MLNTFNLLCCSSSVDESRSISDKFLMSLYRSQGLCILVFYLLLDKTVSNISFSFFLSTISIWFHGGGIFDSLSHTLLFKKPSGSERVQECVHALEDWGQDIRDTETHAAFCKRNNYPLYVSMLNSPSFLKWDILYSLICPLMKACSVFHLLFSAFWPPFHKINSWSAMSLPLLIFQPLFYPTELLPC